MRELRRADVKIYLQALGMYLKNPVVALAPLAAGVANLLLMQLNVGALGSIGVIGLLSLLLDAFGLAVAVIAADYAFRRNRAPLDQAWHDARRKISDILLASLGLAFVMFLPSLLGGFLGPLVPLVQAVAFGFVIYTIPAAAIGGTPGAAALEASVRLARANPAATALLFLVCYAAYNAAPLINAAVVSVMGNGIGAGNFFAIITAVSAFTHALCFGYIAFALAKAYADVSYGRRFF